MQAFMSKEKILQYVKENMPSGLLDEEKALYIAMCIAECKNFNERYLWSSAKNKKEIYEKAQKGAGTRKEKYKKRKMICVGIADLFYYVAKNMGLEVYIVADGKKIENLKELKIGQHVYNAVRTSDGRMIRVDVQADLDRLQTHCKLMAFGSIPNSCKIVIKEFQNINNKKDKNTIEFQELQEEEIERCVRNTKYIPEGSTYTDEHIREIVRKNNGDEEILTILNKILNDEKVILEFTKTGTFEAYRFCEIIMGIIQEKNESAYNQIEYYKCKLKRLNKKSAYNFLFRVNCEDKLNFFMFSKKEHKMIKVELEELEYMLENGLKVTESGKSIKEKLKNRRNKDKRVCKVGINKNKIKEIMLDDEDREE